MISAPNLDISKKVHPNGFSKIHFVIHFIILAVISHPHFLMGYYHVLSDAFQNKTFFAGLCKIYVCF